MKWEELCKIGLELPEAEEGIWFRTPALKVRGKSFVRLKEDGASVVFLLESVEEQEFLIASQPDIYFITDHYRGWPAVLARLSKLRAPECRLRLEQGWRLKAPKSLIKQRSSEAPATKQAPKAPATKQAPRAPAAKRAPKAPAAKRAPKAPAKKRAPSA
jgi:hypothetical protein